MPDETTIRDATGRPTLRVHRDGTEIKLTVRNGTPVSLDDNAAAELAEALTRRWPMIGPPSPEAISSGDWRPA
jgi:hypothetical protein